MIRLRWSVETGPARRSITGRIGDRRDGKTVEWMVGENRERLKNPVFPRKMEM